jgi:hypothetical protein
MRKFELNQEQIEILQSIYNKRKNLLYGAMSGIPIVFGVGYFRRRGLDDSQYLLYRELYTVLLFALLAVMAFLLIVKLRPIKKDIKYKSGLFIDRKIIRKSYFQHVQTYFLFFEDPKFPNKEVTKEEFDRFNEGDVYSVPISENSKIVLDGFMNYNLL